ncbi:YlmH family RNA-binding protein [Facklamia miroungae]|uniref:RNA-binding protein YlmH, contains S4-like domain n=1 Tax=Facklamia miroungae TaxID=120956 RepID=A0A1G7TV25_9LACT|nr:YlmH/Sll1252 family protein [Facklamia miroungae]NKZ29974.1 RNA-binding protein [Facklamia miroungae]SDG38874.1 RNA-binding protein YlmH, contains S4-like domain [Facklamia miroungae]
MKEDIYQHYRKEEIPYVDQVYDWIDQVDRLYTPVLTSFLTPRQATILKHILNSRDEMAYYLDGGYEESERKRALIYPSYYVLQRADLELGYLEINFPAKFADLTHGKILGTILGTGIERGRIGDIITDGQAWHIIVDLKMQKYLIDEVKKIANVGVHLTPITREDLLQTIDEWEETTVIVSSLRLDSLIAKIYNISRQRAKDAVQAGQVKINFTEVDRSDTLVGISDIVSLRRFGRFRIQTVDGKTKKDNFRLTIDLLQV